MPELDEKKWNFDEDTQTAFEKALDLQEEEKRNPIPAGTMHYVKNTLVSGNGFTKFVKDCVSLKNWSEQYLDDDNIINNIKDKIIAREDKDKINKGVIQKVMEELATKTFDGLPLTKKSFLSPADIQSMLQVLFVYNAIPKPDATTEIDDTNSDLAKAKKDFPLLNEVVFRRYRMKKENQIAVKNNLKVSKIQGSPGEAIQKIVETSIVDFFTPELGFLECSIGEGSNRTLRTDPSELYRKEIPISDIEDQLDQASVIALWMTTVDNGWIHKTVQNTTGSETLGKTTQWFESFWNIAKKITDTAKYGIDWKDELEKKITSDDTLSEDKKTALKKALTAIMQGPETSYKNDDLVKRQEMAFDIAERFLKENASSLRITLAEKNCNINTCKDKIANMVTVVTKMSETTEFIEHTQKKQVKSLQATTTDIEIQDHLEKLLNKMEKIDSQRTYNHCLETLKRIQTCLNEPEKMMQASVLSLALEATIVSAEKKGFFRQVFNAIENALRSIGVSIGISEIKTVSSAQARTRFTSNTSPHKEERLTTDLNNIQEKLTASKRRVDGLEDKTKDQEPNSDVRSDDENNENNVFSNSRIRR